ncbi:MAG: hypothetical protein ACE5MM_05480, partial [Nitrospiraceae bacterium]
MPLDSLFVFAVLLIAGVFSVFYFKRAVRTCHNCDRPGLRHTGVSKTYGEGAEGQYEYECSYCGSKEWKSLLLSTPLESTGQIGIQNVASVVMTGLHKIWGEFRNPTKRRAGALNAVRTGHSSAWREVRESLNPTKPRVAESAAEKFEKREVKRLGAEHPTRVSMKPRPATQRTTFGLAYS